MRDYFLRHENNVTYLKFIFSARALKTLVMEVPPHALGMFHGQAPSISFSIDRSLMFWNRKPLDLRKQCTYNASALVLTGMESYVLGIVFKIDPACEETFRERKKWALVCKQWCVCEAVARVDHVWCGPFLAAADTFVQEVPLLREQALLSQILLGMKTFQSNENAVVVACVVVADLTLLDFASHKTILVDAVCSGLIMTTMHVHRKNELIVEKCCVILQSIWRNVFTVPLLGLGVPCVTDGMPEASAEALQMFPKNRNVRFLASWLKNVPAGVRMVCGRPI